MIHVPYRGDMFPDLIGGQVQVYFGAMGASIELIRAGKLPALAVTTATRWEGTPDIPTVDEFVPGYEASVCRSGSRHLVMLGHPAIKLRKVPQSAQRFDQHLTQRTHSLTVGSTPHISGGSSFLRKQSRIGCQHRRFLHLAAGTPALGGTVNFDS
jgi:Tripartite tricarboxylate transporter family receptor